MPQKTPSISRRTAFKAGIALAAGGLSASGAAAAERTDAALLRRFAGPRVDPKARLLLKGGVLISMDEKIGDLVRGDILIQGRKIAAVGARLEATDADVIDAVDMILIPGLVDCHRHAWEGQLRRINPNARTLAEYSNATHLSFGTHYRPRDMYVGNLITALGCIDAGITCVIDNSHNARTAEHSDAAIAALFDSGIRAVHASGAPQAGVWNHQWPGDLARLQRQYFSSADQLVTLRMFSGADPANWKVARDLGLRMTSELHGARQSAPLEPLWQKKLVGPDNTFNHCGDLSEQTWQILRDSGATIDVCPRSDAQYALGEGVSAFQHALDHGMKPGFSVDNETSYSTDLFAEMRTAFFMQRALAANRKLKGDTNAPAPVGVREILACATVNGAHCAGLADKIGTLAPGKDADIVMIRSGDINLYPSNNALGTVVQAAERSNIDTVLIGGRLRKFRGALVGFDRRSFAAMVEDSRNYLFAKTNYTPDMFAEELPKLG